MLFINLLALLIACALADSNNTPTQYYNYSPAVGTGSGISFSLTGAGRITGVRVWENYSSYVRGIQLRFGFIWSEVIGSIYGEAKEIELYEDEAIIQISGKYNSYLSSVEFITNKSRSLHAGTPVGHTFNMYAGHRQAELFIISGYHQGSYIRSFGAHWTILSSPSMAY